MTIQVDLNCDLGESFGAYTIGQDTAMLKHITSANIACGYHAGDHNVIRRTVQIAVANDVGLGAHPGFPDLIGFGRRHMQVDPQEVYNLIVYQVGAIQAFAQLHQRELNHVKPHGALFNIAARDETIAQAIAEAVYHINPRLILFGLAGGELVKAGQRVGLTVAQEVFADRTYQPDGTLTPRTAPNAMIVDVEQALQQVIRMVKDGKVEAVDGSEVSIKADTVCIHGDQPTSLLFVQRLRQTLVQHGIVIRRVGT